MVIWYAVTTPLEGIHYDRHRGYGTAPDGGLYALSGFIDEAPVAVIYRAGAACLDLAKEKAQEFSGAVIKVRAEYMFDDDDIPNLKRD